MCERERVVLVRERERVVQVCVCERERVAHVRESVSWCWALSSSGFRV